MRCILFFLIVCVFFGCKKDNLPPDIEYEQMVLVYISANNDLNREALTSVDKITAGYETATSRKLLVYIKTSSDRSYLIDIKGNAQHGVNDTLKIYHTQNSADPLFIKSVIDDARRVAPARQYGLVLWSHATSWVPPKVAVRLKSFAWDDNMEVDIKDMAKYLPNDFEYILFDACSMASAEVCYELKDNAKYILASPAEVLSTGFPYASISNDFFLGEKGLTNVAKKFIDYYQNRTGLYASATISLIRTEDLVAVAEQSTKLLLKKPASANYNRHSVQNLTFDSEAEIESFDFVSFLKANYTKSDYEDLERAIQKSVLYKANTSTFLGVPIEEYCGLSIYIPVENDRFKDYYSTLRWSQASNWLSLFV